MERFYGKGRGDRNGSFEGQELGHPAGAAPEVSMDTIRRRADKQNLLSILGGGPEVTIALDHRTPAPPLDDV
jgi:hypothetical protein